MYKIYGKVFWGALFLILSFASHSQIINTFAGNGVQGYTGDGGQATVAQIAQPMAIGIDGSGNIYVVCWYNNVIRKVNPSGIISTFAGNGYNPGSGGFSGDGGPATAAEFNYPWDIAIDASGNVYIADENNSRIRKVNTSGIISTYAGNGTGVSSGNGGQATAAGIGYPDGVATDASGNVYITDGFHDIIRVVTTSGIINVFAGTGISGYSGDGGPATAAQIAYSYGISFDASGNAYIPDAGNDVVRKVNTSGIISTFAGDGVTGYSGDGGPALAADFNVPYSIAFDASGNTYVADNGNSVIRKINASGIISTYAGNGVSGYYGDGGPATSAEFFYTWGIAVDASGNVYVADANNNRARKISETLHVKDSATANASCNGESNGSALATASGGVTPYTYLWTPGAETTATVSGLGAGTYTVTVTDNSGATSSASVTITQPLALSVSASVTTSSICNGENGGPVAAVSGGTPPYMYSWSNGGGTNGTNATTNGLSAGTYTVTVTDAYGCEDSVTVVNNQTLQTLTVEFTCNLLHGCPPFYTQFFNKTISSSPIKSFAWTFGDGDSSSDESPIHCYLKGGKYTVGLTVYAADGCSSTLSNINMINVYNPPDVAFSMSPQPTTILSPTVQFTNQTTDQYPIVQWIWTFEGQKDSISNEENPEYKYPDTGTYCTRLVVTDVNGCTDTATNCLVISPLFNLYIPDAFTPNGDGINDVFMAKGEYVKSFEMYVFNRWGEEIFYSNDITKGWNGAMNGSGTICLQGAYVYKITAIDSQNKKHSYVGEVSLIK